MTPVEGLLLLSLLGCAIFFTAAGGLEVEGQPDSVVDEFLLFVRENKAGLLALLADPRKEAYRSWEAALGDVATHREAHARRANAAGLETRWLDDELLTDVVREAILAAHDDAGLTRATLRPSYIQGEYARPRTLTSIQGIAAQMPADSHTQSRWTPYAGELQRRKLQKVVMDSPAIYHVLKTPWVRRLLSGTG